MGSELGVCGAPGSVPLAGVEPASSWSPAVRSGYGRWNGTENDRRRYSPDLLVYSYEVGMEKPDRRIYQLTCAWLGRPAGTRACGLRMVGGQTGRSGIRSSARAISRRRCPG